MIRHPGGPAYAPQRGRARALAPLVVALLLSTSLSGCLVIDFFTPRPDDGSGTETPDAGVLRIWAAAKPGQPGNEFAHYNVTFGLIGHSTDLLLQDLRPLKSTFATVDLIRVEKETASVLLAQQIVPPGQYRGIAFSNTQAAVATERVIGNEDGEAVTSIKEDPISYEDGMHRLRVNHNVAAGLVTDVYLEIDLVRSLQRDVDGKLRHVTTTYGASVYVNGLKADHQRFDGGGDQTGAGGGDFGDYGSAWRGEGKLKPPSAVFDIWETDPDEKFYTSNRYSAKLLLRAIGLDETLHFDATKSHSNTASQEGPLRLAGFFWDFGDSTTIRSATPVVEHNYTNGGIYEVVLQARDEKDLVGRDHVTVFVPYRADEAERVQADGRAGTILLGSQVGDTETGVDAVRHTFRFEPELDDGALVLGGYRVTTTHSDPTGGIADANELRLRVQSGQIDHTLTSTAPMEIATGGIPFWRGPLNGWVEPEVDVTLELRTGVLVDYDLEVEALYYQNASRGFDSHAEHLHGAWMFGPKFTHLHHDGTRNCAVNPQTDESIPEEERPC